MSPALLFLHAAKPMDFGQYKFQQATALQQVEPHGRTWRSHDFIQFIHDTLLRDDGDTLLHAADSVESVGVDEEAQLGGETYATHHAERVVTEGDIRVERCTDNHVADILHASERVHQFSETLLVQTDGQSIDGEVTTVLIILQGAGLDNGFAGILPIRLFPGTDELHLHIAPFHLGGTEVLEDSQSAALPSLVESLRHLDAATDHHHVNIVRGTLQEDITDKSAYHITLHTLLVRNLGNQLEYFIV